MAKLTLSIDGKVATRAKRYAKKQGRSVSSIVETYLDLVSRPPATPQNLPPILRELRGSLRKADISDYHRHLEEKYK